MKIVWSVLLCVVVVFISFVAMTQVKVQILQDRLAISLGEGTEEFSVNPSKVSITRLVRTTIPIEINNEDSVPHKYMVAITEPGINHVDGYADYPVAGLDAALNTSVVEIPAKSSGVAKLHLIKDEKCPDSLVTVGVSIVTKRQVTVAYTVKFLVKGDYRWVEGGQISLKWSKGTDSDKSIIRYKYKTETNN